MEEALKHLKTMRLSVMADAYLKQKEDPNADLKSFDERFKEIVEAEWDSRYSKKLNRYMRKATLKYPGAEFDDSLYESDRLLDTAVIEALCRLTWIDEGRNILITGKTGTGNYVNSEIM